MYHVSLMFPDLSITGDISYMIRAHQLNVI